LRPALKWARVMVRVESRLQIPKKFSPRPPPTLSMATLAPALCLCLRAFACPEPLS